MLKNISLVIFIGLVGYSIYSMNNQKNVQPVRKQAKKQVTWKQECNGYSKMAETIASLRDRGYSMRAIYAQARQEATKMNKTNHDRFLGIINMITPWVYTRQTGIMPRDVGYQLYIYCTGGPAALSRELNR